MLPDGYRIRTAEPMDFEALIEICQRVYPTEKPYTLEELHDHYRVFPEGQFVVIHESRQELAGVHLTLRLRMKDFHVDDPWDVLTAGGSFLDHDPDARTLYGADIMVHPEHQHHGLARALTDQARFFVRDHGLWRMVGASRLPGYAAHQATTPVDEYVESVVKGERFDPVLSIHLKDGWTVVRPIHGYLQHDDASAGWAVVMQWVNPASPSPLPDFGPPREQTGE